MWGSDTSSALKCGCADWLFLDAPSFSSFYCFPLSDGTLRSARTFELLSLVSEDAAESVKKYHSGYERWFGSYQRETRMTVSGGPTLFCATSETHQNTDLPSPSCDQYLEVSRLAPGVPRTEIFELQRRVALPKVRFS